MKTISEKQKGIGFMLAAYIMWGLYPVYWKMIDYVPALEVLCHRVTWCFAAVILVLLVTRQFARIKLACHFLCQDKKKIILLAASAVMLNANWLTYIWAVQNGHIVESSMGYYVNPLVSVLLGVIFLKEKLSIWQKSAFVIAALGVLNLAFYQGKAPWIPLGLAFSFALYGLFKKKIGLDALSSMTLESAVMCIFSVPWLTYLLIQGKSFLFSDSYTTAFLLGAGPITLLPLIFFSAGVLLLPLSISGFLQYINPTMQLCLGVCLYQETFTIHHGISFILIWIGVLVFSLSDVFLAWKHQSGHFGNHKKKEQVHAGHAGKIKCRSRKSPGTSSIKAGK